MADSDKETQDSAAEQAKEREAQSPTVPTPDLVSAAETLDNDALASGRAPAPPDVTPLDRDEDGAAAAAEERLAAAQAEVRAASVELYAARAAAASPTATPTLPAVRRLRGLSSRQISQLDPSVRDHFQGGYLLAQAVRTPVEQAQEVLAAHGRVVMPGDALRIFREEFGEEALAALGGD